MWHRQWGIHGDPFDGRHAPFAAIPSHVGAVARLARTIEAGGGSARLIGAPGVGKSTVLARALDAARDPTRKIARAIAPVDGAELFAMLAIGLGSRVAIDAPRALAWRALSEAARLCRWQRLHVVLAVDDGRGLATPSDRADLDRLDHLDPDPSARLTVLRVDRTEDGDPVGSGSNEADRGPIIRLAPLTRTEAAEYLAIRLAAAGHPGPTFTPRALARLHLLSGGIPRRLDRLASAALADAAGRGLEIVPPEVVEAVSLEVDDLALGRSEP